MDNVWSCGGGVQSIAIAALIVQGRLPKPDYSVIADTGYERSSTWEYMEFLQTQIHVDIVKASEYATVGLWGGKEKNTLLVPAFSDINGPSKLPNFCSNEWKQRVIDRWLRGKGVKQYRKWLGFSTDEARRAKDFDAYYPLIELGMSRDACMALIGRMGWPSPPRSSCWMCPNHSAQEWREIKESKDWASVVAFEKAIQRKDRNAWLTKEMIPIEEVDFSERNADLFADSGCESGQCFV
jgi:hypothetical protein